ncbi:group II intron maturase-specific domain-containing protein [Streptomyces kaempferi]|uniref:Group II intron maturase-specific domain-containing protein n=1 Tax=Streptomyces kaempferi TaxID=333725 RepID=A0ABW3XSH7_9ACTN
MARVRQVQRDGVRLELGRVDLHHHKRSLLPGPCRGRAQRCPPLGDRALLRDKVRAATACSRAERPVSAVVADLNPVLRGWAAYFRNGNSGRKFDVVDGYVHERLAIFASAKHRLAGRNWTTRFTYGWITRLGVYRLTGNVHRATAHASR